MTRPALVFAAIGVIAAALWPLGVIARAPAAAVQAPRADLAPTGTLRAAFLQTNPVQGRVDPQTGAVTGPVADLVRELARQKGVPFTILPVPDAAAVIDHVNTHKADIGFLAYEAARASQVDFSQPYLLTGSAYLVRADSALNRSADVDRAGIRVAAVKGVSQQIWVSANVTRASVQVLATMPPDEAVAKMIAGGELDAFAANRERMETIARKSPAVRVLTDNFMVVAQALVVEKGQTSRLEALNAFVAEVRASGLVKSAIERAGLSGVEVAK